MREIGGAEGELNTRRRVFYEEKVAKKRFPRLRTYVRTYVRSYVRREGD